MQQTMKQYITAMRINHVRALLSDTDKTIRYVSTAGFCSSSRFKQHLYSHVSMPPQQYRKLSQQRRHGSPEAEKCRQASAA